MAPFDTISEVCFVLSLSTPLKWQPTCPTTFLVARHISSQNRTHQPEPGKRSNRNCFSCARGGASERCCTIQPSPYPNITLPLNGKKQRKKLSQVIKNMCTLCMHPSLAALLLKSDLYLSMESGGGREGNSSPIGDTRIRFVLRGWKCSDETCMNFPGKLLQSLFYWSRAMFALHWKVVQSRFRRSHQFGRAELWDKLNYIELNFIVSNLFSSINLNFWFNVKSIRRDQFILAVFAS